MCMFCFVVVSLSLYYFLSATFFTFRYVTHFIKEITVSREIAPCNLIEADRRFRDAQASISRPWWWKSTTETSVSFCETTQRNIPKNCYLHIRCLENPTFSLRITIFMLILVLHFVNVNFTYSDATFTGSRHSNNKRDRRIRARSREPFYAKP